MQDLQGLIRIEICYHVTKSTDIEAMDLLLDTHMRKYNGDWVASDYKSPDRKRRWFDWFWPARERSNTYIITGEDLEDVKSFIPGVFYVKREDKWAFMSV